MQPRSRFRDIEKYRRKVAVLSRKRQGKTSMFTGQGSSGKRKEQNPNVRGSECIILILVLSSGEFIIYNDINNLSSQFDMLRGVSSLFYESIIFEIIIIFYMSYFILTNIL
jgi:hypothetical protein